MNFGKIILGLLGLAVVVGAVFWVFSGGDESTPNAVTLDNISDTRLESSQSAATPADQLPGQTANPGVGSTESMPLTKAEVSNHNNVNDCWTIVNANVYDITTYIPNHQGGEADITRACGKDATALFSEDFERDIADYQLGQLES